jgi:hypothetical protein
MISKWSDGTSTVDQVGVSVAVILLMGAKVDGISLIRIQSETTENEPRVG